MKQMSGGRNKSQDIFLLAPYKVMERKLPNMHEVDPLDRNGPARTVYHRKLLLDSRELVESSESEDEIPPIENTDEMVNQPDRERLVP